VEAEWIGIERSRLEGKGREGKKRVVGAADVTRMTEDMSIEKDKQKIGCLITITIIITVMAEDNR